MALKMLGSPVRVRLVAPLFFLSAVLSAEESGPVVISILPVGSFSPKTIQRLSKDVRAVYSAKVLVLPPKELPSAAYYSPRRRYRADKLLEFGSSLNLNTTKLVILTTSDISTTAHGARDWGVFGLGQVSGKACVVSTFRLKGSYEDLRKVVIHELGHTVGLQHCPTAGCVMQDAKGSIRTLKAETGKFCPDCAQKAKAWIRPQAK